MSKINYRRKDTWKIKFRKPISIRPPKPMEPDRYDRRRDKTNIEKILREGHYEEG